MLKPTHGHSIFAVIPLTVITAFASASIGQTRSETGQIELRPCPVPGTQEQMLCGTYEVFENRAKQSGRKLALNIAVLPARNKSPEPDPIFWITGGPGDGAARWAAYYYDSWLRQSRDLVMVDQRGTGESNPLICDLPGSASNPQGYLDPAFKKLAPIRRCRNQLRKTADLKWYSTPTAMDDLDEVRQALGYDQINIYGVSYGSRAALVYARRHAGAVRTLLLSGIAPISYTAPLYHARGAQRALELILAECAADSQCSTAYPNVANEFNTVLDRLTQQPAMVTIADPHTGAPVEVALTRAAFADSLRTMMYNSARSRWVPYLIHLAFQGDPASFADFLATRNRYVRESALGLLLSVTCPEDVARIDAKQIPAETDGTFFGDGRVRQQGNACRVWPQAQLPANFGDPIESDVPVLMWSGQQDPVTPPEWGERAAENLPNSLHAVVPGAHSSLTLLDTDCFRTVSSRFLDKGSVRGLNTRCANRIKLPPWEIH